MSAPPAPTGAGTGVGAVSLRVTVCAGQAPTAGSVELDVPDGLTADVGAGAGEEPRSVAGPVPCDLPYGLPADGYAAWDVTVRATDPEVPPGRYFLAARIRDGAGQIVEDVATIAVGEQVMPPRDTPLDELLPLLEADERSTAAELDVTLADGGIILAPGDRGALVVRLANHARSQIRGEAQLVSPFGTWEAITPWTQGFTVEPGAEATVSFGVAAPAAGATARPGAQWWALVKVCYFGRVRYTSAIRVSLAV